MIVVGKSCDFQTCNQPEDCLNECTLEINSSKPKTCDSVVTVSAEGFDIASSSATPSNTSFISAKSDLSRSRSPCKEIIDIENTKLKEKLKIKVEKHEKSIAPEKNFSQGNLPIKENIIELRVSFYFCFSVHHTSYIKL